VGEDRGDPGHDPNEGLGAFGPTPLDGCLHHDADFERTAVVDADAALADPMLIGKKVCLIGKSIEIQGGGSGHAFVMGQRDACSSALINESLPSLGGMWRSLSRVHEQRVVSLTVRVHPVACGSPHAFFLQVLKNPSVAVKLCRCAARAEQV
jgi:hypothetical protein